MNNLKKLGAQLEKLYMGVGAVAMGLLAFLVIFTVIMRYCFSLSWKSVSEFCVLLFTFTTFWGMGLNVLKNEHVSINILYDRLPPVVRKWLNVSWTLTILKENVESPFFPKILPLCIKIQKSTSLTLPAMLISAAR